MRKFKVGDIVLIEAQLASAIGDIREKAFGQVGEVLEIDNAFVPIRVRHAEGLEINKRYCGDDYYPEELYLLGSVN